MKWVLLFAAGFGVGFLAFQVAGKLTTPGTYIGPVGSTTGGAMTPGVSGGFAFSAFYITIPAAMFIWWKFGLLEAIDFGAGEIAVVFYGLSQITSSL